jgi:hypothetical protein
MHIILPLSVRSLISALGSKISTYTVSEARDSA